MRKIIIIVLMLAFSSISFAALGDFATTKVYGTGQMTEGPSLPGNVTAEGGNVSRVDLEANYSTSKWQGFYGNVTGRVALGLSTDILYDFGNNPITSIYASQNASFDFANINWTGASEVDSAFGFSTPADLDQAVDVYDSSITIDGVTTNSTILEDGIFASYAIEDQSNDGHVSNFAFGGNVSNAGATAFDGNVWQYEFIVPVNAGTPTYYFFMSI